jgi:hypothetical protein
MPCDLIKSSESSNPTGNLGNRFHYGEEKIHIQAAQKDIGTT